MVLVGAWVSGAAALHAQTFDFEAAALNTTTPFSQSNGGVTATFTSPDGANLFSVTTTFFSTLTGHVLLDQNAAPDRLAIGFNQSLSTISMNFATNGAGTLTLAAFFGANPVGSVTLAGAVPAGFTFPEGIITFTGGPFDNVLLSSTAPDFAIDNITVRAVSAVPEPAAVALVATGLLGLVPVLRRRAGVSRG
jgi:hypothetical protein